jgi:hypothetical protein
MWAGNDAPVSWHAATGARQVDAIIVRWAASFSRRSGEDPAGWPDRGKTLGSCVVSANGLPKRALLRFVRALRSPGSAEPRDGTVDLRRVGEGRVGDGRMSGLVGPPVIMGVARCGLQAPTRPQTPFKTSHGVDRRDSMISTFGELRHGFV